MSSSSINQVVQGLHASVTPPSLHVASQSIKSFLEQHVNLILRGDEHYLIDAKEGEEASEAWRTETLNDGGQHDHSAGRIINRMSTGVIQKRKNELFPWFTFCFRPAMIDEGDGGDTAFLNLKAVNNISPRLWAMIRVHQPNDSKRPDELFVYVSRNVPTLDQVIDPQLRIPFKNQVKLQKDERVKALVPNALFSDNLNLGTPLQIHPSMINICEIKDDTVEQFTISHRGDDALTICEINCLDFDGEVIELDGIEISGIEIGEVIKANQTKTIQFKRINRSSEEMAFLQIEYFTGTEEDLDDGEEMMADEELVINLQGSEEWSCHVFLSQGEAFSLLKQALLNPDRILEQNIQEVNLDSLIEGEINPNYAHDDVTEDEDEPMLMLNEADFDTGTLGTVSLAIQTQRQAEDFAQMLSEEEEAEISELDLTFGDAPAISERFRSTSTRKSQSKKTKNSEQIQLDLIYLGQLKFYNNLRTVDQVKFKDFLLKSSSH